MIDWIVSLWEKFWELAGWEKLWLAIGMIGQLLFMARFLVQWIVSEQRKRSVIPVAFWYLSLSGSLVLLSYAIHKRDPVFILGQSCGVFIYVRNLVLLHRRKSDFSVCRTQ